MLTAISKPGASASQRYTDRYLHHMQAYQHLTKSRCNRTLLLTLVGIILFPDDKPWARSSKWFVLPVRKTLIFSQPNSWHVTNCSFKGHPFFVLLRAVEGVADVVQGLSRSVHGSHQLSIFLCDLSYWLTCLKIAEMGWTQTWAPKSLGWSTCQWAASPSASVSHKTSNLFGRQMTLLSLVSRGPLRVRSILFSSWGSQCWSRGAEQQFWS